MYGLEKGERVRNHPRRPQFPARPESSNTANVTSAVGLEETVGHSRARRTSLFTNTVMWVTGLVCAAFLVATLAQAWSNSQLEQQLQKATQQYEQVNAHNQSLKQQVNYYKDPAVIESEARQQLNYVRPGEHAVMIVGQNDQPKPSTSKNASAPASQDYWQEWWQTFFGN
jgi:cell division protein FtsB